MLSLSAAESAAALAVLDEHELGPAVGLSEHCAACGWTWSVEILVDGREAGCPRREAALVALAEAGLI